MSCLVLGLFHKDGRVDDLALFRSDVVLDVVDLVVKILELVNDLIILLRFLLKSRPLIFDLLHDILELGLGLLGTLLSPSGANLGVLEICLQLVVALLKLADLPNFFQLSLLFLFLHVGELVEQLVVASLLGFRVLLSGGGIALQRSVALVECVRIAIGAARGNCGLETNLDPGTLVRAFSDLDPMHLELIVIELR